MTHLTIREIADAWKEQKRPYVSAQHSQHIC